MKRRRHTPEQIIRKLPDVSGSHCSQVLAELPRDVAEDLLARLDRVVPGRIQGFYVVGSASMGAFRAGRSDVDFVAIVDGELRSAELVIAGPALADLARSARTPAVLTEA